MKPLFPFLLLIFTGLIFAILARPVELLAGLRRMPQQILSRLMAKRPDLKNSGLSGSSSSVPRQVAQFNA